MSLFSSIDNIFSEFKESYIRENQANYESFKIKKENEKVVKSKALEQKLLTTINDYNILFDEITRIKEENIIIKFNVLISEEKKKNSEKYTVKDLELFYIKLNEIKTSVIEELTNLEGIKIKNSEQNEMNFYFKEIKNKIFKFNNIIKEIKKIPKNKNKYIKDLYLNSLVSYEINVYNNLFKKLYKIKQELEELLKENIELLYDKYQVFNVLYFIYSCQNNSNIKRWVQIEEMKEGKKKIYRI